MSIFTTVTSVKGVQAGESVKGAFKKQSLGIPSASHRPYAGGPHEVV
jgi:hypothetical protein